jgi:hypothetical protein
MDHIDVIPVIPKVWFNANSDQLTYIISHGHNVAANHYWNHFYLKREMILKINLIDIVDKHAQVHRMNDSE